MNKQGLKGQIIPLEELVGLVVRILQLKQEAMIPTIHSFKVIKGLHR
jgi:hypothetical protein